ncbi:MAG TPA: hypothetical protein VLF69_00955 [Candidatus Saccharimonadales bacterium]|nr:hypothetical protein [Candidatus Saccharimonadales bacterium]
MIERLGSSEVPDVGEVVVSASGAILHSRGNGQGEFVARDGTVVDLADMLRPLSEAEMVQIMRRALGNQDERPSYYD